MTNEHAETVFAAWAVRVEAGDELPFDELLSANTDCAEELLKLHDDWKLFAPLLGRVVPGLIASSEGMSLPPLSVGDEDAPEMPSSELLDRLGIHAPNSGRYRFRSVIGRGGGGIVLKVWDTKLNRPLAMKVVLGRGEGRPSGETPRVDGRTLSRFVDEARIASQLNHPGIVPVHELGADESGRAFFTMKLVRGEDLSKVFEHVKTGKDGWNQTRALTVLQRVCEAMAFAHDKGVVHRDLKPANIMVGRYGEVYVMDWGLARVQGEKEHADLRIKPPSSAHASVVDSVRASERGAGHESPLMTMGGQHIGTPAYMSPEQAKGDVEAVGVRSDVYAIGAMVYELLARQMPYVAPGTQVGPYTLVRWVTEGPPKPLAELAPRAPAELMAIAEKAMERNPVQRYPATQELGADIRAFLEGHVVKAYESGTLAETKKWMLRNTWLAASLACIVIVTVCGSVAFYFKAREHAEAAMLAAENEHAAQSNAYAATVIAAASARAFGEQATERRLLDSVPIDKRQWEWQYLDASMDASLYRLEDGHAPLTGLTFSPDGSRVAGYGSERFVRIWDAATGTSILTTTEQSDELTSAIFSPDGSRLVTVSADGTAYTCKVARPSELLKLQGDSKPIRSAAFSPTGLLVATASESGVSLWKADEGTLSRVLPDLRGPLSTYSFSPDGSHIVGISSSDDTEAAVVNVTDGTQMVTIAGKAGRLMCTLFDHRGRRIAMLDSDGIVRVWDPASNTSLLTITSVATKPDAVQFSHDDSLLLAVMDTGGLRVVDLNTGRDTLSVNMRSSDPAQAEIWNAWFTPDDSRIITSGSDGVVRVWDSKTGLEVERVEAGSRYAITNPDATRIATLGFGGAAMFDSPSARPMDRFVGHEDMVCGAASSPDGTQIVTAGVDRTARVWDSLTGLERQRLVGHSHIVVSARFSHSGHQIVTASWDGFVRTWNSDSGSQIAAIGTGVYQDLSCASFSPDDSMIVSAGGDMIARIWNSTSVHEVKQLHGHTDYIESAEFSPDGRFIVTASRDRIAYVWRVAHDRPIAQLQGHSLGLNYAEFSPDGRLIATASNDSTAMLWDSVSGKPILTLAGHTDVVCTVRFSPDGARLVTASQDNTVRIWDTHSGQQLARLTPRPEPVSSATWSADGSRIIVTFGDTGAGVSEDGSVLVLDSIRYRLRHNERMQRATSDRQHK